VLEPIWEGPLSADLVETILAAAAEAIRTQTPAITSDAGGPKSITLELELANNGAVVDSTCWVERRGMHRQEGA
jgi:hypothetical protein